MHTGHPDVHDHGLQDDCEACTYHADNPLRNLDQDMLHGLVERALADRFDLFAMSSGANPAPRSDTEAVAMANVLTMLEQTGKLAEVAPGLVARYVRERWRVPLVFNENDPAYAERQAKIDELRTRLGA